MQVREKKEDAAVKLMRIQLRAMKDAADQEPIHVERAAQEFAGAAMQKLRGPGVKFEEITLSCCKASLCVPPKVENSGLVIYLHGGGYCCGDTQYARGFGSVLAAKAKVLVLCPVYRLAPEFPFPAGLDDALESYRYALKLYPAEKILLTGESAGGGLIYALCQRIREEGLPMPGGLAPMSPWTDLTASGGSYAENKDNDPSISLSHLQKFVALYCTDPRNPLVSPLFGDLRGLPESEIFVGGDEIMRDDAVLLHEKLLENGCQSTLTVAPGMWHGYILYGLKARKADTDALCAFIGRITK